LRLRRVQIFAAIVVWASTLHAAETPIPPSPTEWVTDNANFLSPATVSSLNARLAAYEQRTGHQVIVYVAPTTGDTPLEDWTVRAFAKWKVGRKGLDDGLALFLFPQDRKVRIEVGYGLEPIVTDAIASRVINEVLVPKIRAGQADEAVTAGVDTLTKVIDRQPGEFPPPQPHGEGTPANPVAAVFWGIVGILILGFFLTHPRLALYFLMAIMSGGGGTYRGGGGGGGWSGGGFGGGGGRSGGGGASGSW